MKAPRWSLAFLRFLAPGHREDDVLGDVEEAHRKRIERRGSIVAWLLTSLDALDLGFMILRDRLRRNGPESRQLSDASNEDLLSDFGISWLDFKLGFRMLLRYPGLTVVSVLAMAFAITVGATNLEYNANFLYPRLPLDEGDRIVEIRHQDISSTLFDFRALHDFVTWRDELRSVQEIGA